MLECQGAQWVAVVDHVLRVGADIEVGPFELSRLFSKGERSSEPDDAVRRLNVG
jgi:hypothetical protein